jgi:hypothetical protein
MVDGPGFRFQGHNPVRSPPCRSRTPHPKMLAVQEPDEAPRPRACWWTMVGEGSPPGLKAGTRRLRVHAR